MAKKSKAPAAAAPVKVTGEVQQLLSDIAEAVLSDYFFDPEHEDEYAARHAEAKAARLETFDLMTETVSLAAGECSVALQGMKQRGLFRLIITAPGFEVALEGAWSFAEEEFQVSDAKVLRGTARALRMGLEQLTDELVMGGPGLDELAEALNGDELWLNGDEDDLEPPAPAPAADRQLVHAMANRIMRAKKPSAAERDREQLMENPQWLAAILDNFVAEAEKPNVDPDSPILNAYFVMMIVQLNELRFRLEEGHAWAGALLRDAQERIVAAAEEQTISNHTWVMLARALTEARIMMTEEMRIRLADAGLTLDAEELPADLGGALRETLDAIADMSKSPFDVIDSLQSTGAIMPSAVRCFLATELAISPHAVLRDGVPLLLFDNDASVRSHVALTLDQAVKAGTLTATSLRRIIGVRNWLPPEERATIDGVIRTARLAGVEPAAWPQAPGRIEAYASVVDGSAAQSVIFIDRSGRKVTFSGILLRHTSGIRDAWLDPEVSRAESNRMLDTLKQKIGGLRVDPSYADRVIQHGLAAGLDLGSVPPPGLLHIAEVFGISTWQDRRSDVAAEVDAEFRDLPPADQTAEGLAALNVRALEVMQSNPIFGSWFESGPEIEQRYAKVPRQKVAAQLLAEDLPERRKEWTERFLFTALCYKASLDLTEQSFAPPLIGVAKVLAGDEPLAQIPAMQQIALWTVETLPRRRR